MASALYTWHPFLMEVNTMLSRLVYLRFVSTVILVILYAGVRIRSSPEVVISFALHRLPILLSTLTVTILIDFVIYRLHLTTRMPSTHTQSPCTEPITQGGSSLIFSVSLATSD